MNLGAVALVALIAGLAGGAIGAALVGTVEGMLRWRLFDSGWTTYARGERRAHLHGGPPFDDFSDRAKRILALSQDEATRFNHSSIGPEHLLLGLSREGDGVAGRALASLGATLPKLRATVESTIGRGQTTVARIDLSEAARAAIRNAREEARKLGHSHVATEHLLLGLVREGGTAVSLLGSLGVEPERVVRRVTATFGHPQPALAFRRLDVDSQKVITLARQEAIQSGHAYIGSENLAMALRLYSTPTLGKIWSQLAIDAETLRRRIEAEVPPTLGPPPTEGTFTPRVSRVIAMANSLAAERQLREVRPEILLMALADEGGGTGARVLASFGATSRRVREIADGAA